MEGFWVVSWETADWVSPHMVLEPAAIFLLSALSEHVPPKSVV